MRSIHWTLAVLLLFSCFAVAGDKVPYSATLASTESWTVPANMESPTAEEIAFVADKCGTRPAFWVGLRAVGNMTHSGLISDEQGHCVSLLPPSAAVSIIGREVPDQPNVMIFYNGKSDLTAANHDVQHGTYDGYLEITADGMIIHGVFVTTGGTGRFAGVTGTGTAFGVQTFGPEGVTATLTLTGTQTSVGAAKK